MSDEPQHKDVWAGMYHGVPYEIIRWYSNTPPESTDRTLPIWNYYIVIDERRVPEERRAEIALSPGDELLHGKPCYDYMQGLLANLDWHGGITYYQKQGGCDGAPVLVKAGCDYNHAFDEGMYDHYDMPGVLQEVKRTIDDLYLHIPNLWQRCGWNGEWTHPDNGAITADGRFHSHDGLAERRTKCPGWPEPQLMAKGDGGMLIWPDGDES